MAKYNIYAVAVGRDPDSGERVTGLKFATWNEAKPYVQNVEKAKYKGFMADTEATIWISNTLASLDDEPEQACTSFGNSVYVRNNFINACNKIGKDPNDVVNSFMKWFGSVFN